MIEYLSHRDKALVEFNLKVKTGINGLYENLKQKIEDIK